MPVTLQQLVDEPADPVPFIIKPLLTKQGKLEIYGPAEHFKSMLLMNMLYELAEGEKVLGRWTIEKPYTSLFVEQELGDYGCKVRFTSIHRYKAGTAAGANISVTTKRREIRLDHPAGIERIKKEIESCPAIPEILALDPIRKFYHDDESDSTSVTKMIHALDKLIEDYKFSVIFTHHEGWEKENGKHNPRGSSVFRDEPDAILRLSKPTANEHIVRVTPEKIRHGEKIKHFDLVFDKDSSTFKEKQ